MKSKRILVVEDDGTLRGAIVRYLKRLGYDVQGVSNGFEALLLLQYLRPSLIISDIRMPKLGGLTLVEAIQNREETRGIPLILTSAYPEEKYFNKAKELGVKDLLIKPFTLAELHGRILSVLGRIEGDETSSPKLADDLEPG